MVKQIVGMVLVAVAVTVVVPSTVVVPDGIGEVNVPEGIVALDSDFRDELLGSGLDEGSSLADTGLKEQGLDNLLAAGDWHRLIPWREEIEVPRQLQFKDLRDLTVL